jgi:mono/diheme cytochrome c family protein
MISHPLRVFAAVAILASFVGATVRAADPWNTGNPWNAPSRAPSDDSAPQSAISGVPTVDIVPSVRSVPTVGTVPYWVSGQSSGPGVQPSPLPPITTNGIAISGNPNAGAHIVAMKCAGCHGQDGSGHGTELMGMQAQQAPIPWTDKAAMAQLTDQGIAMKIANTSHQDNPNAIMPSFGGQLTQQQIGDVVAYIRSLAQ